jgi:hypothetical protein
LTWLGVKTRYSVLLATVAHAAANLVSDWFEPNWLYFAEMIGGGLVLLPVFWWLLARERAGSPLTSE